jgi:uncharacterized membrane protein YbaN (DUF454 family)
VSEPPVPPDRRQADAPRPVRTGAAASPPAEPAAASKPSARKTRPALGAAAVRLAWRLLAVVCVVLGLIGVVLPGLPTVPFLLVAAWAGGRGWPRLEQWLLAHPRHGPAIRRWREHRAVPRRAKWAASLTMVVSTGLIAWSSVPLALKLGVPAMMAGVAAWLWRRPER